jgi:hypothetical protein
LIFGFRLIVSSSTISRTTTIAVSFLAANAIGVWILTLLALTVVTGVAELVLNGNRITTETRNDSLGQLRVFDDGANSETPLLWGNFSSPDHYTITFFVIDDEGHDSTHNSSRGAISLNSSSCYSCSLRRSQTTSNAISAGSGKFAFLFQGSFQTFDSMATQIEANGSRI